MFSMLLSISFGPVAFLIFRQSITFGFCSSLPGVLGAAVADAVFAAVAFTGLQMAEVFWVSSGPLLTWLAILYLFYLGATTFKKAASTLPIRQASGFIPVFLLTLTSPLTVAAISSYVIASGAQLDGLGWYFHLMGFLLGSFLGQILYALGGATIRRMLVEQPDFTLLNRVSGMCLIGFAAWQVYRLVRW